MSVVPMPVQPGADAAAVRSRNRHRVAQPQPLAAPDVEKFPCLRLARQTMTAGGVAPAGHNRRLDSSNAWP